MNQITELPKCLCCDRGALTQVIDFKETLLANNYSVKEKFPLRVNRCTHCNHLQLAHSVDPSILFSDYPYFSGTSKTFISFCKGFAKLAFDSVAESKGSRPISVMDIACNDGTQLDAFRDLGLSTYGIDPAKNVGDIAKGKGHSVFIQRFEDTDVDPDGFFDIITAQNVLAHTPTPLAFLEKCRQMMRDHSRLFITTSQANMILNTEFDSIYHEHISYFNAYSLGFLLERAGLQLLNLTTDPIHGTSYIAEVGIKCVRTTRWEHMLPERSIFEEEMGLHRATTYSVWEKQVWLKTKLARETILDFRQAEHLVFGCGAAAKGITFMNIAGIQPDYLLDTTPAKWGKTAAGTTISPFHILKDAWRGGKPLLLLILAWNFEREVRKNILALRDDPRDSFLVLK